MRISKQQHHALSFLLAIYEKTGQAVPVPNTNLFKYVEQQIPSTIYHQNFTIAMHKLRDNGYVNFHPVINKETGRTERTKLAWQLTKQGYDLAVKRRDKEVK